MTSVRLLFGAAGSIAIALLAALPRGHFAEDLARRRHLDAGSLGAASFAQRGSCRGDSSSWPTGAVGLTTPNVSGESRTPAWGRSPRHAGSGFSSCPGKAFPDASSRASATSPVGPGSESYQGDSARRRRVTVSSEGCRTRPYGHAFHRKRDYARLAGT